VTRRTSAAPKPTRQTSGGSALNSKPSVATTRRAEARPEPKLHPPGGSNDGAKPAPGTTRPGGPSLRDLIREADTGPQIDDTDLARSLLETLLARGQVGVLLPILADEVRRLRRRHVRQVEQQTFRGQSEPAEGGWLRLLPEFFTVPDGRMVTWGTATVEDHEARMEWLHGQIHALASDVDRHEQAVKLIREHGVTCLAEIEAAV